MSRRRLLADVGGTNLRFAFMSDDGELDGMTRVQSASYSDFSHALRAYLGSSGTPAFEELRIAAAGPVDGDSVALTNAPWQIDTATLRRQFADAALWLVNDLAAVAMLLPYLTASERVILRAVAQPLRCRDMIAVNIGTGFGAACAMASRHGWRVRSTEAGHMRLSGMDVTLHESVCDFHCVEDLLSGRGLAALRRGLPDDERGASLLFSEVLGRVCGDLVLATGSWGGVYLCGGVFDAVVGSMCWRSFFQAFDDKGAMTQRMRNVPVFRIIVNEPVLHGLARWPWESTYCPENNSRAG